MLIQTPLILYTLVPLNFLVLYIDNARFLVISRGGMSRLRTKWFRRKSAWINSMPKSERADDTDIDIKFNVNIIKLEP
jgi:hypothetical protein